MLGFSDFKKSFLVKATIFIAVWLSVILFFSDAISGQPAIIQFGLVLVSFGVPAFLIGQTLDTNQSGAIKKAIGLTVFGIATDLISPPLLVDLSGETSQGGLFLAGASDAVLADFWKSVGFSGNVLFGFVYGVSFLLLIIIAVVLLSDSSIKNSIGGGVA